MAKYVLNIPVGQWTRPAEAWETENPVLLKGQMGIEEDTGLFKLGDGVSEWNKLKYSNLTTEELEKILDEKGIAEIDGEWLTKGESGITLNEDMLIAFLNNCVIDGGPIATEEEPEDE